MATTLAENDSKRRDKLVIIAEIIDISKNGTTKTHIMFQANLSFTQLNKYLLVLIETGLLEKAIYNNKEVYKSTEKGLEFLEKQCQIIHLLNGGLSNNVKTSFGFNAHPNCKALRIVRNPSSSVFTVKHQGLP